MVIGTYMLIEIMLGTSFIASLVIFLIAYSGIKFYGINADVEEDEKNRDMKLLKITISVFFVFNILALLTILISTVR